MNADNTDPKHLGCKSFSTYVKAVYDGVQANPAFLDIIKKQVDEEFTNMMHKHALSDISSARRSSLTLLELARAFPPGMSDDQVLSRSYVFCYMTDHPFYGRPVK